MQSCFLMLASSDLWTNVLCVKLRFCLVPFFVRMWLLKACLRLILPDAVSLKRFFALDLVFIFGMASDFYGLLIIFYFFFGLNMIVMRLPSNLGICSTEPISSSSVAKRNNRISPRSLNTMVLPLKKT